MRHTIFVQSLIVAVALTMPALAQDPTFSDYAASPEFSDDFNNGGSPAPHPVPTK